MKKIILFLFLLSSTFCFGQRVNGAKNDFDLITELIEIRVILDGSGINFSSKAIARANIEILESYSEFALNQIFIMGRHLTYLASYKHRSNINNIEKINELKEAINFQQSYLKEARVRLDEEHNRIMLYNKYKKLMVREKQITNLLDLNK